MKKGLKWCWWPIDLSLAINQNDWHLLTTNALVVQNIDPYEIPLNVMYFFKASPTGYLGNLAQLLTNSGM